MMAVQAVFSGIPQEVGVILSGEHWDCLASTVLSDNCYSNIALISV